MAFKRRTELGRCRAELFPIALVRDRGENARVVDYARHAHQNCGDER